MKIGNIEILNKTILAPMAGVTNYAFRKIAKEQGVGLIYSEMVSDKGIDYQNEKTLEMLEVMEDEHPIAMQIFGSDINTLVKAAIRVDQGMADIIDLNMGCPVNKVIKNNAGVALMKDPMKIFEIVKEIVKNVKKPVTVKIRSGWDYQNINACLIAKLCEEAGASAICVHPRTKTQLYSGLADWEIIKKVKESVKIPVIGNGDIKTALDAKMMIEKTNCDFVMVGRGSLGNPWIFNEINIYLDQGVLIERPSKETIYQTILKHIELLKQIKCEKVVVLEMRSHIAWYVRGLKHNNLFRVKLNQCKTINELILLLNDYFDQL